MSRNIVFKVTIAVVFVLVGFVALQPMAKASLALNAAEPDRLLKAPEPARFDAERFSVPAARTSVRFDAESWPLSLQPTGARFDGEELPGVSPALTPRFDDE